MAQSVQIEILDGRIVLCHKHMTVAEFWVDKGGHPHFKIFKGDELSFTSITNSAELEVQVITKEKSSMGLPRRVTAAPATNAVFKDVRTRTSGRASAASKDTIDTSSRDAVLLSVLDALIDNPTMSKRESAEDTKRIAEKFGVKPMAVAGVKANFTRGAYGDPATEIATRMSYRKRARANG